MDDQGLYLFLASLLGILDKPEGERTPEESKKLEDAKTGIKIPDAALSEEAEGEESPLADLDDAEAEAEGEPVAEGVAPLNEEDIDLSEYELDEDGKPLLDEDGNPIKKKKDDEEDGNGLMDALSDMIKLSG